MALPAVRSPAYRLQQAPRAHLLWAILQGIACEQAFALNAVETSVGTRVTELVAIGGGAANALWTAMMADITGRRIILPPTFEASTLGAGIAAAMGAGWYPTFAAAARSMTGSNRALTPDPGRRALYRRQLEQYQRIYPSVKRI